MEGYVVNIETVMQLAQTSYHVAELYAEVAKKLVRTDEAHGHLTDQDGAATAADTDVIAMLNEFDGYVKTTTARYYLTGEQLEATAKTYVENEGEQQRVYEDYKKDWEKYGVGDYDLGWDPEHIADDTARPEEATTAQPDNFGTDDNPAETNEDGKKALEGMEDEK